VSDEDAAVVRTTPARSSEEVASTVRMSAFAPPDWAKDTGRWGWIIIGVTIVLVAVFAVAAATRLLVMAALFAILLGGTFLPVVDWLERHHFRRWMGALLVVALSIVLAILVALVIVYGLVNQVPTIKTSLQDAADSIQKTLNSTSIPESTVDEAKSGLQSLAKNVVSGAAGTVGTLINGAASLIFGIFISINIGVWVLIRGREIGAWASHHVPPVPQPVAYRIFANSARFFRGYIWGSTIIGLFNGAVLLVGALIIGVPMAATIAIVAWITNYIPYFGAIISGAFAVLIAYGAGGPSKAIPMLIVVIIANGFLQTIVSQFALGSALNLHPLVVLFATTAGGILFGAVGGVFAAPFVKISLDAYERVKDAGVFESARGEGGQTVAEPFPDDAGPPGTDDEPPGGPAGLRTAEA
jgi:predicted PurR-regulated permease PerM